MTFQDDIDRALRQMDAMDRNIKATLPRAAQAGAGVLKAEVIIRAPVRTGRLRGSIEDRAGDRETDRAEHVVYSTAFYAGFVEYGRRKRPFLRPAADSKQAAIETAMKTAVNRAFEKAVR